MVAAAAGGEVSHQVLTKPSPQPRLGPASAGAAGMGAGRLWEMVVLHFRSVRSGGLRSRRIGDLSIGGGGVEDRGGEMEARRSGGMSKSPPQGVPLVDDLSQAFSFMSLEPCFSPPSRARSCKLLAYEYRIDLDRRVKSSSLIDVSDKAGVRNWSSRGEDNVDCGGYRRSAACPFITVAPFGKSGTNGAGTSPPDSSGVGGRRCAGRRSCGLMIDSPTFSDLSNQAFAITSKTAGSSTSREPIPSSCRTV